MSSQAKHTEKNTGYQETGAAGGRSTTLTVRGASDPQTWCGAAWMHPPAGGGHRAERCGDRAVRLARAARLVPSHRGPAPLGRKCRCCTKAPFVLAASRAGPTPAPRHGGKDGTQQRGDGCTKQGPSGPSKATCKPARSSLSASHRSARRLINFLFVFQSFIFKLQSSLLSNKYSTIKAFFSPTCDSNISVSHPPVTFPAINRFVKTAFDAPAAISHLKSHNYHPIMGLLTSSKNKAIEYGNLFVN